MPMSVECPECGAHYNVPDKLAGKRAKCKKCGATIPIPAAPVDDLGAEDDSLSALAELAGEPVTPRGTPRSSLKPPPGWTPESVIVEKEANPSPSAAIGSGRWQRRSGGLGRIVKRVVLLGVLVGIAYGGWYGYNHYNGARVVASAKDKLLGGKKDQPAREKPAPDQPPPPTEAEKKRADAAEDLKKIYAALTAYVARNAGNWPPDLATLRQDGALPEDALQSPFGPAFATGDYVYKPFVAQATASADAVLAHDAAELASGEGANVLFADGSVKWLDKQAVASALQQSEQQRTAAASGREQQVAMARQQEQQRQEQQRAAQEQAISSRVEIDPTFRPPSRRDVADRIRTGAAGLVKEVRDVAMRRGTEQLVRPVVSGSAVAVLVRNNLGDTIEVFDSKSAEPVAAAQFQSDQTFRANPGAYALSPDGKLIARLTSWPNVKASVYSFEKNGEIQSIDLDDKLGDPTLVGFLTPDKLVIRWQKYGKNGLEVWDAKAGRRGRQIELFDVQPQPAPGSEALSPDGHTYALINHAPTAAGPRVRPPLGAQAGTQADLQVLLYDVVAGGQPRRFQVPGINSQLGVQPAGLAFSPDKTRLAALFVDNQGRAVVVCWPMGTGRALPEHVVPEKLDPPHAGFGRARSLDWVADGRGLLVGGRLIMSPDTGDVLATLDAGSVRGQAVTGESTVHLAYGDSQLQGMAVVPLDESKLPAKPTGPGASPGRAMAAPTR